VDTTAQDQVSNGINRETSKRHLREEEHNREGRKKSQRTYKDLEVLAQVGGSNE
jgi:hypothetical protein